MAWPPTSWATPVLRVSAKEAPLDETVPWPSGQGKTWSQLTTCSQLPPRAPPMDFWSHQFWVASLLPPARRLENNSITLGGSEVWRTVAMHRTHDGRVNCELGPSERRKTVNHNFQTSVVRGRHREVHVLHESVGGDPTSLQILAIALSSANPLHPRTPAPVQARLMAKDVNGAATRNCRGVGGGRHETNGRHSQNNTCARSSLRTDESSVPV